MISIRGMAYGTLLGYMHLELDQMMGFGTRYRLHRHY